MKKYILAIVAVAALAFSANAQTYGNSVGLVLAPSVSGNYAGVQWNHFLSEKNHVDVRFLYNKTWGPSLEAMYDWDIFFSAVDGLDFYVGPGVHAGYVKDYNGFGANCASFGLTAVVGLEYAFSDLPLALSLDWHPYLTWEPKVYGSKPGFGYSGIDLCVKYCF